MKIREVLKKGIAGLMTATMLLGNYSAVLASDGADTEVVAVSEDEAVSENEAISENEVLPEDEAVSENETVSEDEADKEAVSEDAADEEAVSENAADEEAVTEDETAGDDAESDKADPEEGESADVTGTLDKPEKLEFGKEVAVSISKSLEYQWYIFTPEQKGYIELYVQGNKDHDLTVVVHQGDNPRDIHNVGVVKGEAGEKKVLAKKAGLRPGTTYIVQVGMNNIKASEGVQKGAFQIDFKESEYWEEELDSEESYKTISNNTTYYGTLDYKASNYADFYSFEVTKAGTVKIYEKGGSIGDWAELYSDDKFENKIAQSYLSNKGATVISKKLAPGKYYLKIRGVADCEYEFKIKAPGGSSKPAKEQYPATGKLTMNGKEYNSVREAIANMTEETDYVIDLQSDMIGEKPLTFPKKAKSVMIMGHGHSIVIKGSKLTAKCPLRLQNLTIKAVHAKKEGVSVKLNINAKKGFTVAKGVVFDALSTKCTVKNELRLLGSISVNNLTTDTFKLESDSSLTLCSGCKMTVKKELSSEGDTQLNLYKGFKPIALKGSVSGSIKFHADEKLPDGTQILSCSAKKISPETLKKVFDCSDLTANTHSTYLYYLSGSKVCIFGEVIEFNGHKYGVWKDAVAEMNSLLKEAKKNKTEISFEVAIKGDVNMMGKFLLPKKGYKAMTITAKKHSLSFTGDITLTGDLTISDSTKLYKLNKKNEKVAGKIKTGKFTYTGPQITVE